MNTEDPFFDNFSEFGIMMVISGLNYLHIILVYFRRGYTIKHYAHCSWEFKEDLRTYSNTLKLRKDILICNNVRRKVVKQEKELDDFTKMQIQKEFRQLEHGVVDKG